MRGSESWRVMGEEGVGGVQGWVRGSGMMLIGMPRLTKVAGEGVDTGWWEVFSCGCGFWGWVRVGGREEEKTGLSVRRLWIRGLRFRRVPTPRIWGELCGGVRPELAAAWGVVSNAEEEGGRIASAFRSNSRFLIWCLMLEKSIDLLEFFGFE